MGVRIALHDVVREACYRTTIICSLVLSLVLTATALNGHHYITAFSLKKTTAVKNRRLQASFSSRSRNSALLLFIRCAALYKHFLRRERLLSFLIIGFVSSCQAVGLINGFENALKFVKVMDGS